MTEDEIKEKTVEELLEVYPDGFAIGPGGSISKTLIATSHFRAIAMNYPFVVGNQGYLVVEMME